MEVQVWFVGRKELSIVEKGSTPRPWSVSHFFISIKNKCIHKNMKIKAKHLLIQRPSTAFGSIYGVIIFQYLFSLC